MTFYRCPACGKRGVTLRLRDPGEDNYGCRYCQWYVFTGGYAAADVGGRAALIAANPDRAAELIP